MQKDLNEKGSIKRAVAKYVRITPSKLSLMLQKIRGKTYFEALKILSSFPQKTGTAVWKVLRSAAHNVAQKSAKKDLLICEAFVNKGPTLKKIRPRAKGKAYKIEKKKSHIYVLIKRI